VQPTRSWTLLGTRGHAYARSICLEIETVAVTGREGGEEGLAIRTMATIILLPRGGAWMGNGTHILKGVTIGEGAVVGANSVVMSDVPPFALALGNPAEVLIRGYGKPSTAKRKPTPAASESSSPSKIESTTASDP